MIHWAMSLVVHSWYQGDGGPFGEWGGGEMPRTV